MKIINRMITAILVATASSGMYAATDALSISEASPSITENFNSMWDASQQAPVFTLPKGWAVDRNLDAPRKVGSWDEASTTLMYEGGISLASNAKNGTWNFGASTDPTDRAVGGLSTTVNGGTRCVSLMTALHNDADKAIDRLTLSYDIEKYRNGANAAGFDVQLYYSYDGSEWINAGNDFKTHFAPDGATAGETVVPISTSAIGPRTLMVDVKAGSDIYLAWNISVATGATPDKAQGLAIDNVSVSASFASADSHYIYVENATGAAGMTLYSPDNAAYGPKPGIPSQMAKNINGVTYSAWPVEGQTDHNVVVTAGGKEYGPAHIIAGDDNYLCASPQGLDMIADPDSYTGWVDPSRPPFVSSGIYLRGDVNTWGADASWEFSDEGDGTYVLYDKTLSGGFKVADASWSSSCNYGSNGSNIMIDAPYNLVAGTDNNVSCGAYVFDCKRIVLNIKNGQATIMLESNDDETGLTSVYMVGDFNGWNYMSTAGELKLDESDNTFKGRVSLKAGSTGMSQWLIYQRLGKSGAWGAASENSRPAVNGTLVKGNTYTVYTEPSTYDVTFSLADGSYNLVKVKSEAAALTLNPANTVLVPRNPEKVKVLSLNNSLIYYNDQDKVFNDIAAGMNKDAAWTKHTLLGKPLSTHWDEGDGLAADGTPGARMMVRSEAWSHIILQEQSSLPRTSFDKFRANVKQWVDYIREYCPNPNAVIILPVNWAYSGDWDNYNAYNKLFLDNYKAVAEEMGVTVCPVAAAYDNVYCTEGTDATLEWYLDDRHPSLMSTYMAACMEYGLIFGEDPADINSAPAGLDAATAAKMRRYASDALKAYINSIDHHKATIRFNAGIYDDFGMEVSDAAPIVFAVDGGGTISTDGVFVSDGTRGTFTVTATSGTFEKKANVKVADAETVVVTYPSVKINKENPEASQNFDTMGTAADAAMPKGWRIDKQTTGTRAIGTYATASEKTTYSGGTSLPSNAKNGVWNFGADGSSDRAVGGITTGVANGSRAINVYAHLYNDGKKAFDRLDISYDVEKYRKGNNAAGFAVQLHYSFDGRNWQNAGEDFRTYFEPDNETAGYAEVPGETVGVNALLPVNFGPGLDLYLAWNISVASGDAAQGAMALGIDNVVFKGIEPEIPDTDHRIDVDKQTSWTSLGLYAWGDGEIFGAWPGIAPLDEVVIEGKTYQMFGLNAAPGTYNLIFNNWNNGKQLPDFTIKADRDYWFRIDDEKVTEITPMSVIDTDADGGLRLNINGSTVNTNRPCVLEAWTLQGVRVKSETGTSINLDNAVAGMYIVTARGQEETASVKVRL